ncbi:MAG: hypothetical protein RIR26_2052 [Pseudomonadota bacterium]
MQHILEKLTNANCFLWDFDGCFADTEQLHFLAYRDAFAQFGHQIREADYYPSFTHLGDGTRRELELHKINATEADILSLKAAKYGELIRSAPVSCFSETLDLVDKMRDRGAKVAIASNSPQDEIQIILERSGFPLPKIDVIVGKSAGLRKKPAPDIFLRALEMLGLDAGRAIVLEDSNRGLSAAAAAGCGSIWIRTQYNKGLSTAEPHLASMTHKELLGVFQNLK